MLYVSSFTPLPLSVHLFRLHNSIFVSHPSFHSAWRSSTRLYLQEHVSKSICPHIYATLSSLNVAFLSSTSVLKGLRRNTYLKNDNSRDAPQLSSGREAYLHELAIKAENLSADLCALVVDPETGEIDEEACNAALSRPPNIRCSSEESSYWFSDLFI